MKALVDTFGPIRFGPSFEALGVTLLLHHPARQEDNQREKTNYVPNVGGECGALNAGICRAQ